MQVHEAHGIHDHSRYAHIKLLLDVDEKTEIHYSFT